MISMRTNYQTHLCQNQKVIPVHQINVNPSDWQPPLSLDPSNNNSPAVDENVPEWTAREPTYATVVTVIPYHCHSSVSTLSSSNHDVCRICHCEGEESAPLLAPCYCSGSLRYVHQTCLQEWIKTSDTRACELCKFTFIMHSKTKPFCEWEKLEMSTPEIRILWFAVFHMVLTFWIAWILYELVEEASHEYVHWSFWMKVLGFVFLCPCVSIFMFKQFKAYIILCRKWRSINREIFIQNAPETVVLPPSPTDSLPLKELGHILPCNIDPACASQMVKPDSDTTPQKHEARMKFYVFDNLSPIEDSM